MTSTEQIKHWLTKAGWKPAELAQRARISPSTMTRLMRGRSVGGELREYELGELVAMKLERATVDAYVRGDVNVMPLRALDLLPATEAA